MNTPKRLLSGSDDATEYPAIRRRTRSANDDTITPIDDQIEQVAKRYCVPSDIVKRIISDLLTDATVIDYLRTRTFIDNSSFINNSISTSRQDESLLSTSNYFDINSQLNPSHTYSPSHQQLLPTTTGVDEYDPLWLEFLQSLNTADQANANPQQSVTQSTITLDSLFTEDDEDDEEFIGPDDEHIAEVADDKKLRVSKRELALLLKDSTSSPMTDIAAPEEELLRGDQYESLWTEFLASLQTQNNPQTNDQQDEQQKSVRTTTTEDDDNDDDPEFHLPDTDYEVDDDLGDELHVSKRELALLLEDNASILNPEDLPKSNEFLNPDSVSSTATDSTVNKSSNFYLTHDQRNIFQYQLSAYVQLLTQYILLRRETDTLSSDNQSATQLFKDLIYLRNKQSSSILNIPLLTEAQRLLESPSPSNRRKALGNHLPFHLMDTFCKSPAFVHDSLLPTCLLSSTKSSIQALFPDQSSRNFVSGEDWYVTIMISVYLFKHIKFSLMALGLEQNDAKMLIIGHNEKSINERLNSLRYARVRRGKQNPVRAFFTYGSVPDISLSPWYRIPFGYDIKQIYLNGLIEKVNVVFPSWFRLSYKRSRQLTKHVTNSTARSTKISTGDPNDSLNTSTVYVVVEGTSAATQSTTSPSQVLQQIHMLHLLNSYPKLQPKQ
ncbi:unnamed protein product [Adineta ricciae]|uniref:Uncharacterized protein n=1 Tax=Adineta ricciae TaxID=249248 RepID=A0A815ETC0_ADIRI|nr:unnamed protein product [Adineta ricciae]